MLTTELAPAARPPAISGIARYALRAGVFLALLGFLVFVLQKPMQDAFMANPGLNGVIIGVLAVGILLAGRELWRLSRETRAARALQGGRGPERGREPEARALPFLGPLLPALPALQQGQLPPAQGASVLEAISVRLDEGRENLRYLAGLLVFLGLLGTFWGLLETVSSVGNVIRTLRTGGEAGVLFEELKAGLAAPLAGMGLSFSSSLFGIAGSLVLGFLDLQLGQAQRRFRTEIEDWLATGTAGWQGMAAALPASSTIAQPVPQPGIGPDLAAQLERVAQTLTENAGGGRQATQAMANLAEGIQGLVQHMRSEQQMIRDWVEAQANRDKDTRRLIERLLAERTRAD
jgi:hypothetical protein